MQASQLADAGRQLNDLSNRLSEANRISGEQYIEINDLKAGKENAEQVEAIEDTNDVIDSANPTKSILEEMRALSRRFDAMETQKISEGPKPSTRSTLVFENTVSNLRQELKDEGQAYEEKAIQRDIEHVKQVSSLELTVTSLKDTISIWRRRKFPKRKPSTRSIPASKIQSPT